MSECCAAPGCEQEGTFPAPRNPRNLGQRQYFCQTHIKEFNKQWNGLNGFNEDEIFAMQHGAATWNRPTWKLGVNNAQQERAFESAEDLYRFFRQRKVQEAKVTKGPSSGPTPALALPPDVREACVIFGTELPLMGKALKAKYLALVKAHHPDTNPNANTPAQQDLIKRINVAYKILTEYHPKDQATDRAVA